MPPANQILIFSPPRRLLVLRITHNSHRAKFPHCQILHRPRLRAHQNNLPLHILPRVIALPGHPSAVVNATQRPGIRWLLYAALLILALCFVPLFAWLRSPLPPPRVLGSKQLTHDGLQKFNLLTDGSRLYFVEISVTRYVISQVSTAGGEVAHIDVPHASPYITDVSPDGSELLGGDGGLGDSPVWSLPLPAGSPRRLGGLLAHNAA